MKISPIFLDDQAQQTYRPVIVFFVECLSCFFKSILIKWFAIVDILGSKHFGFTGFPGKRSGAPFHGDVLPDIRRYSDKTNLRARNFRIFKFENKVIVTRGNIEETVTSLASYLLPIYQDTASSVEQQIESE